MTQEQRAQLNKLNAQHSTGPKTDEGKAIVAQNALKHGLTSSQIPLHNTDFLAKLTQIQQLFPSPDPLVQNMVLQLAHVIYKIEQIPQIESELLQNSDLTLAEHFMQNKPTPLTRLWNLELRLQSRFQTLLRKLTSAVDVPSTEHPSAPPLSIQQNKPTPVQPTPPSAVPTPTKPLSAPIKPLPTAYSLQPTASNLQNKPTSTLNKLSQAIQSIPLPIPNPFECTLK